MNKDELVMQLIESMGSNAARLGQPTKGSPCDPPIDGFYYRICPLGWISASFA